MQVRRIGLIAILGLGGAFGFGVLANACLDMVWPSGGTPASFALASASNQPVPRPEPAPAASAEDLVGTADIRPVKVKTIQMVLANPDPAPAPSATVPSAPSVAAPRPRPAPHEITSAVRPSPAKRPAPPAEDADDLVLSNGQIDRIRTALALSPDQEAYWPGVAAELRAIAKQQPKRSATKGHPPKLNVDPDSVQRLYTAAAPLIMRLREDQKRTARQLALMLGLQEVAEAL